MQAQAEQLLLTGKAPQQDDPQYLRSKNPVIYGEEGMTFAARLGIQLKGGSLRVVGETLQVTGADEALLFLCAATSFNGFDRSPTTDGKDPLAITAQTLAAVLPRSFDELLQEHLAEYQPLFQRVALNLGNGAAKPPFPPTSASPRSSKTRIRH